MNGMGACPRQFRQMQGTGLEDSRALRCASFFDYRRIRPIIFAVLLIVSGCSVIKGTYNVISGTVKGTVWVIEGAYELTAGTTKVVYHIGKFTFESRSGSIRLAVDERGYRHH